MSVLDAISGAERSFELFRAAEAIEVLDGYRLVGNSDTRGWSVLLVAFVHEGRPVFSLQGHWTVSVPTMPESLWPGMVQ